MNDHTNYDASTILYGVNIDIFVKGHTRDIRYCFAHNFLILVGFEWESLGLCSLSAKVPISLI